MRHRVRIRHANSDAFAHQMGQCARARMAISSIPIKKHAKISMSAPAAKIARFDAVPENAFLWISDVTVNGIAKTLAMKMIAKPIRNRLPANRTNSLATMVRNASIDHKGNFDVYLFLNSDLIIFLSIISDVIRMSTVRMTAMKETANTITKIQSAMNINFCVWMESASILRTFAMDSR